METRIISGGRQEKKRTLKGSPARQKEAGFSIRNTAMRSSNHERSA